MISSLPLPLPRRRGKLGEHFSATALMSAYSARFRRRDLLQVGSLGAIGLSMPELMARRASAAEASFGRAKSCLLMFLEGGPAQHDLWDMKPDAPREVRGEFDPIATSVPGIDVCEHLPLLAQQMQHVALIRSVHHSIVDHNAGAYYAMTGRNPVVNGRLIVRDEPENFPPFGSVLAKLRPSERLPDFVHIPEIMFNNGYEIPGERAGFLGPGYDPLLTGDPSAPGWRAPGLRLFRDCPLDRLDARERLLMQLDSLAGVAVDDELSAGVGDQYEKAFTLLTSQETRQAFEIEQEPEEVRIRYALPDRVDRSVEARKFGGLPHLGQCLLLARRLIEAGVPLVTVCTGRRIDQTWDGHREHFDLLRRSILPYFDRAFSAVVADLADRGLLDETLVVAMGEFGRTPRIGQITSAAGATDAGRDHWPHCYTMLMAGAGVKPGYVHGSSDRDAAYPDSGAVTPEDVAATIYWLLGIDPRSHLEDPLGRPHVLALGEPILDVMI